VDGSKSGNHNEVNIGNKKHGSTQYIGGLHASSRAEGAEEKSFNEKFGPFIPCRPDSASLVL
jgi:hypothetical protein